VLTGRAVSCASLNAVTAEGIPTRAAKAAIEIMKVRMVVSPWLIGLAGRAM
jgi:hypothetical protein